VEAEEPNLPEWPASCRGLSADPNELVCTVAQEIVNTEGVTLFRVAFQRQAWRDEVVVNVRTPLSLFLPKGVSIGVDQSVLKTVEYERCGGSGCDVFTVMSGSDMNAVLEGQALELVFWRDGETSQSVSIPLARFSERWAVISGKN
jgi:invasion protein IalB